MLKQKVMAARCVLLLLGLTTVLVVAAPPPVDCVLGQWGAWTPCTEACDCGLTERVRDATPPTGGGKACPEWNSESMTCNCQECTATGMAATAAPAAVTAGTTTPASTAAPAAHLQMPAASAHGYMNKLYAPEGGFPTDYGEQGACVLDKAGAILDLVPAFFRCDKFDAQVGEPCYAESIIHLARHTDTCCEGREHFVLWASDTFCETRVAVLTHKLRAFSMQYFAKCVGGDAKACAALRSESTFKSMASVLSVALSTARELYAKGKPGDLTPAAKAFLKVCVPQASDASWLALKSSLFGNAAAPPADASCIDSIKSFASEYTGNAIAKANTRRRLLRGAVPLSL